MLDCGSSSDSVCAVEASKNGSLKTTADILRAPVLLCVVLETLQEKVLLEVPLLAPINDYAYLEDRGKQYKCSQNVNNVPK